MSDSLKAISKSMKAAGLQKLRWYCGMCAKQCRDENGFKCHCLSEAHLRQMELFRDNPQKFIEAFSHQFERAFLEILRRKGGRLVKANEIYQEQISDKEHIRMNSTKWDTLSAFVQYLGKTKQALVEIDEKGGLWVKFIKAEERLGGGGLGSALDIEIDEEETIRKRIAAFKAISEQSEYSAEPVPSEVSRPATAAPIQFAMFDKGKSELKIQETIFANTGNINAPSNNAPQKRKFSALEQLMQENEASKARQPTRIPSAPAPQKPAAANIFSQTPTVAPVALLPNTWLQVGLIVKIQNSSPFNGEKVPVESVEAQGNSAVAVVKLANGDSACFPEAELETVLPALNQPVRIVRGPHRGDRAILISINSEEFLCTAKVAAGAAQLILTNLEFEDLCKIVP